MILDAQQKERWHWAGKQLPWDKLRRDDYDFRSWTERTDDLLNAGCAYEYARESHKFRCLLVLSELKRTGPVLMEFERPTTWGQYLLVSGWETWLRTFAGELVGNKSFTDLYRISRSKVEKSLKALPSYSLLPKAVEVAGRHVNYPGSQIIEIQFFWRLYTNKEIGEEMAKLAGKLRPGEWKEPQRKGKEKSSSIKSTLDALSVMRIWKLFPKAKHLRQRIREVAKVTDYKGCNDYVEAHRQAFRAGQYEPPIGNAKVEMSKARAHALRFFQSIFQGEKPLNY